MTKSGKDTLPDDVNPCPSSTAARFQGRDEQPSRVGASSARRSSWEDLPKQNNAGAKQRRMLTEQAAGVSNSSPQVRAHSPESAGFLLLLDEGTLVEVLVRLGVAALAHVASSCKTFAMMCRSEWLWCRMSALRGIHTLDAPGSGWRKIYIALCQVDVVGWSPLPLAEPERMCKLLNANRVPAGHKMVCIEIELSDVERSISNRGPPGGEADISDAGSPSAPVTP